MANKNPLLTLDYSGIFLSIYTEQSAKCVHSAPEHILTYMYSGEQVIFDGHRKNILKAGECAFIRRNNRLELYKNSIGDELYKGISMTFKREVLREFYFGTDKMKISKDIPFTDDKVMKLSLTPAIESLFQSLTPYFDSQIQPEDEVMHLKLLEGIHALLNYSKVFYPILFDFSNPWKADILDFMNDNYMKDLSLQEMARYTARSLSTFKRDFKKISHLTPYQWVIRKRLETAYTKLKIEGKKIKEVYAEVGFKNPSHFATVFKRQYGVSPSEIVVSSKNVNIK